jgi:UDP-2,3-diacylglucosamine pyrophosphatase LpxH
MDSFDALHIVSDLHLGGTPDHQASTQARALVRFIDALTEEEAGQVGLVLNGDLVDFHGSQRAAWLNPTRARSLLAETFEQTDIALIVASLRRFLRRKGRVLVLVLGHDDLELALPGARDHLLEQLCGDDASARGRMRLAFDGTGYVGRVGGHRVLCVHGDEADPWNAVDHAALHQHVHDLARDQIPPRWVPGPGPLLSEDVILQDARRDHPFVGLLQPVTPLLVDVLLALPGVSHSALNRFVSAITRRLDPRAHQLLTGARDPLPMRRNPDFELGPGGLLKQAVVDYRNKRALNMTSGGEADWQRGGILSLPESLSVHREGESLRVALSALLSEPPVSRLTREDPVFQLLDSQVGPAISFIVAGHTHRERALPRRGGAGAYFNSGTWTLLLDLPPERLTRERFPQILQVLARGTLAELERAGLVHQRRTVVSLYVRDDRVHGELRHAAAPDEAGPPWTVVPGSLHSFSRRTS